MLCHAIALARLLSWVALQVTSAEAKADGTRAREPRREKLANWCRLHSGFHSHSSDGSRWELLGNATGTSVGLTDKISTTFALAWIAASSASSGRREFTTCGHRASFEHEGSSFGRVLAAVCEGGRGRDRSRREQSAGPAW